MRRNITAAAGTLVIGVLLGYIISTFAGPMINQAVIFGNSGESIEARAYMTAWLQNDPHTLTGLRPARDVVSRAMELKASEAGRGQIVPVSLTYLGGGSEGPMSVHIYAVEIRSRDGNQRLFSPYALTLVGGKVVRIK
jgi:hypothetical protein